MKHYNIQNYIRYKQDLEQAYKRLPQAYDYRDYSRDQLITLFMPTVETIEVTHLNSAYHLPLATPMLEYPPCLPVELTATFVFPSLKVGGLLIGPETLEGDKQALNLYIHSEKNKFEKKKIEEVRFVPML